MEFKSRTQYTRPSTYRRPAVAVQPRGTTIPSAPPKAEDPVPSEYDLLVEQASRAESKPHVADIGVYHDIIRQKPKVFSAPAPVVDQNDESTESSESTLGHSDVAHVEKEPEAVSIPAVPIKEPKPSRAKNKSHRLVYVAAACVFLLGGSVVLQGFLTNRSAETQVKALQSQTDESGSSILPTDEKPKDKNYIANHKVSPLLPRTITIPAMGIKARVVPLGTDKEGAMQAPSTSYDAGWYTGSSRPGENGAMVIDGHVRGDGGPGIFEKLKSLSAGAEILIERGDGTLITYIVATTETVTTDKLDMGKLLVSANTAKPGLNLITCAGNYDAKNNSFDSRSVVYAVQK